MSSRPTVVLVPSPLVAPDTWHPVRDLLQGRGHDVRVAELRDDSDGTATGPYWRQHVDSAAASIGPGDAPIVLIAHSGAGPLLPLLAESADRNVVGAVFVDAGLPLDGTSRLEQIAVDAPDVAVDLRQSLEQGDRFPRWSSEDLAALVRDDGVRAELVGGLRPRGLDFFAEPLPVPPAWQRVPCGYVRLSPAYDVWARIAEDRAWPLVRLDGGHFQLLDDPPSVAAAIEQVLTQLEPASGDHDIDLGALRYDERGLIPAIVQHHHTGEVLMMAWMTADTLAETLERGETVFWSRSRGERWHKGATSGNTQRVVSVAADCDGDVLLVRVDQRGGGACHTGAWSCFEQTADR